MFKKKQKNNTVPIGTIPRRRLDDDVADNAPSHDVYSAGESAKAKVSASSSNFRRNRNLAPSADTGAGTRAPSARASAHSLRHRRRKIMVSLTAVLGICIIIFILLTQAIFVVRIALYGQLTQLSSSSQQAYSKVVHKYLGQHPIQRIRGVTSLDGLTQYFTAVGHPEIKSVVEIEPTTLGAAQIVLKAREPIASWTSDGTTRYVDSEGVVFSENYYTEPPTRIVDQSGVSTHTSTGIIASSRLLQFIGLVSGNMKSSGYRIKQIDLPANTTREVDLILDNNKRVKMTIDRSAGEQSEDAERSLAYFQKHHTSYKYVDVRVAREAYYK